MILVGQYDSPYVRRVAVSLRVLGFEYRHDTRSVFADFDAMRKVNPLGRIPSLVLDGGETLIDSAAILDWLDETVGPERALLPRAGAERRNALRLISLATGAIDKAGMATYERVIRPPALRWPDWIERCRTQAAGAIEVLGAESWPASARLDQAQITTASMLRYVRMADPELLPGVIRASTRSPSAARRDPNSALPFPRNTPSRAASERLIFRVVQPQSNRTTKTPRHEGNEPHRAERQSAERSRLNSHPWCLGVLVVQPSSRDSDLGNRSQARLRATRSIKADMPSCPRPSWIGSSWLTSSMISRSAKAARSSSSV
jgi:glutathione S-transferase